MSIYKTSKSSERLISVLTRMDKGADVKVFRLSSPAHAVIVCAEVALALSRIGAWVWKGHDKRVKHMKEIDERLPNDFLPCYRNTQAPLDAMRNVGTRCLDWGMLVQAHRVETRSTVQFDRIPHLEVHQRRMVRERMRRDAMRPIVPPCEPEIGVVRCY